MLKKICFICLCSFILSGCMQQKMEESQLRDAIGKILKTYQAGVNTINQKQLESIISKQFSTRELHRPEYINNLLTMTLLIDSIAYTNIRVDHYKVFADVTITGTQIYKPKADIPLYREQIPFMHGTTVIKNTFCFIYEQSDLKLFAEDLIGKQSLYTWGENQPTIKLEPLPTSVHAGDTLTITGTADKNANEALFTVVNGVVGAETISFPMTISTSTGICNVSVMAFAGSMDLNNPEEAILQGAQVIQYSIPIR